MSVLERQPMGLLLKYQGKCSTDFCFKIQRSCEFKLKKNISAFCRRVGDSPIVGAGSYSMYGSGGDREWRHYDEISAIVRIFLRQQAHPKSSNILSDV